MNVCLIYASTSGNVEFVIEFIATVLKNSGITPLLFRSEKININTISNHNKFVFATSTWEHGRLNPFFSELHKEMLKSNFYGKTAAFVGLGDRRYEPVLFCKGIKDIRNTWLANGGGEINTLLTLQGEPYDQIDSNVAPWAYNLSKIWTNE